MGRIDTFTPYKTMTFGFADTTNFGVGNADFPSLWNQRIREGMHLHWDGNNTSVFERNISAAMGAGATPVSLDMPRMLRIRDWIQDVPPPVYPPSWKLNATLVKQGETIYGKYCADCHGLKEEQFRNRQVGTVVPIDEIKTDRERLDSYTIELDRTTSTPWELVNTGSFMNFARPTATPTIRLMESGPCAPFLHNGSVPSLRDLLNPPCSEQELEQTGYPSRPTGWAKLSRDAQDRWSCQTRDSLTEELIKTIVAKARALGRRPPVFFRGYDVYDQDRAGFVADVGSEAGRSFTRIDVNVRGNSHGGHDWGVDLPASDKDALVEYLKTL